MTFFVVINPGPFLGAAGAQGGRGAAGGGVRAAGAAAGRHAARNAEHHRALHRQRPCAQVSRSRVDAPTCAASWMHAALCTVLDTILCSSKRPPAQVSVEGHAGNVPEMCRRPAVQGQQCHHYLKQPGVWVTTLHQQLHRQLHRQYEPRMSEPHISPNGRYLEAHLPRGDGRVPAGRRPAGA